MTHQFLTLSNLSSSLIVLILSYSRSVRAQTETGKETAKITASSGEPKPSSEDDTDTECNWDASLGDYLSCNKEKFTTTQLVGAGIGVTLLIFALAFGILWFVRRKKKPVKNKNKKMNRNKDRKRKMDEEKAKADKDESEDEESESEYDESEDDDDEDEGDKKNGEKHDPKDAIQKTNDVEKGLGRNAASSGKNGKSGSDQGRVFRPVTVEDEDESGELQPPRFLTVPTTRSARSSRIGSPTETRSTRQLYPSNPDSNGSPRNSMKTPARPQRPPSSQWLAGASGQGQESQPSMPPPRYSSKPPTTSNLRAADDQRATDQAPSPSAQRPVSSVPGTVSQRPPPVPRSASMHGAETTQTSYNDMPLPVPPAGSGGGASAGNQPLPARSSSRASAGPNTNKHVPPVPSIPEVSVPSKRPASAYPQSQGQGQVPALTQNPAPTATPSSNSNTKTLTPGMQAVRQTVSAPSNHGIRASSVSVSVHEGDPSGVARAESRKSLSPGGGGARQSTVLEEKVVVS